MSLSLAALLLAGTAAPAGADAITSYFAHFKLNQDDLEPDPNRQVNGDFSADRASTLSDSVSIEAFDSTFPDLEYVMSAHPRATATSTELKSETWIDFWLDGGWTSAKGRAATYADFLDTVDIFWGDVLPDPGYSLAFDWTIDGSMGGRLTAVSDGGYPPIPFSDMGFQFISSADLFFNWSLDDSPLQQSVSLYDRQFDRAAPHNADDPFRRNATDWMLEGGYAGTPLQGLEIDVNYTQVPLASTYSVPVALSSRLHLSYSLQTAANLVAWNTDYPGALNGLVVSSYGSTAKLTGVRLVDANGNNVVGNWDLVSQSGAYYPVLRTPAASVPEPSSLALLGGALAWLAVRRRNGGAHPGATTSRSAR